MTAILSFFALLGGFLKDLWGMAKDPRYRSLFLWLGILLLVGFFFYRYVEGWSWLDSFYFSVITLTTIGYGDLSPTTSASKVFTIVYAILGLTMFATFLKLVTESRRQRMTQRRSRNEPEPESVGEPSPESDERDSA